MAAGGALADRCPEPTAAGVQVFTETQGIVMEFEGTNYLLTCTAVTVADKMGDPAPSSLVCYCALAICMPGHAVPESLTEPHTVLRIEHWAALILCACFVRCLESKQ